MHREGELISSISDDVLSILSCKNTNCNVEKNSIFLSSSTLL